MHSEQKHSGCSRVTLPSRSAAPRASEVDLAGVGARADGRHACGRRDLPGDRLEVEAAGEHGKTALHELVRTDDVDLVRPLLALATRLAVDRALDAGEQGIR